MLMQMQRVQSAVEVVPAGISDPMVVEVALELMAQCSARLSRLALAAEGDVAARLVAERNHILDTRFTLASIGIDELRALMAHYNERAGELRKLEEAHA